MWSCGSYKKNSPYHAAVSWVKSKEMQNGQIKKCKGCQNNLTN